MHLTLTATSEDQGQRIDAWLAAHAEGVTRSAAARLLETTDLSISAVAEQTGFSTTAHFRRVFHELMGEGPLQYRKGHRRE